MWSAPSTPAACASGGRRGSRRARLIAPMPGRVRVLVTAGDEAAARQGLVVVEAMKMK
jgi:biotin carboxyl carrier protein